MRRLPCMAAFGLALLIALSVGDRTALATNYCGGYNTGNCSCGWNPSVCCSNATYGANHGNCVWWAWHKACCSWGVALQWSTNAHTWDNYATSYNYPVRKTPCEKTVFVCEAWATQCNASSLGHVGWVKSAYANGSIDVSEMGCGSWYGVKHRNINAQWSSPKMDYIYKKGTNCCECNPGQSKTQACGKCGTRTRNCKANCQWGVWSACTGEGTCWAGNTRTRDCCDCGTQEKTCESDCEWSEWTPCTGPDPAPTPACDTGLAGDCTAGSTRCVEGCLTCVPDVAPTAELCDDEDNDCDGEVDNGEPTQMGAVPPPYAARVLDYSAPQGLAPGERGTGWALIENQGAETWPAQSVLLTALSTGEGTPSVLWDADAWPEPNALALVAEEVAPGQQVLVEFSIRLDASVTGDASEQFQLQAPTGELIRCPGPSLTIRVAPLPPSSEPEGAPVDDGSGSGRMVTGGCATGADPSPVPWPFALLGLLAWLARRRRSR